MTVSSRQTSPRHWTAPAGLAALAWCMLAGAALTGISGCGAAASPHWAGARPDVVPPADTTVEAAPVPVAQNPPAPQPQPQPTPPPTTNVPPQPAPSPGTSSPDEAVVEVPRLVPHGGPGYRIGVGDQLDISFPYDKDQNSSPIVRPDGMITASAIGEVRAAGRTVGELDTLLTRAYAHVYRRPVVTVAVVRLANNSVYIMGEVTAPGGVEINGSVSLLQLVAKAGGAKSTGNLSSVLLMRRGPGNQVVVRRVDVNRIMKGRKDSPDIMLEPTDIAYVPKNFIGKLDNFVDQWVNGLFNPITTGYLKGWELVQPDRFFFNPTTNTPSQSTGTGQ